MADHDYTKSRYRKVNWFETLKITEDELIAEQNYHISARHMQNSLFRGQGIVKDFEVQKKTISTETDEATDMLVITKGVALLNFQDPSPLNTVYTREIMLNFDLRINIFSGEVFIVDGGTATIVDCQPRNGSKLIVEGLSPLNVSDDGKIYLYVEPVEEKEHNDPLKGTEPLDIVEKCKFLFSPVELEQSQADSDGGSGNKLLLAEISTTQNSSNPGKYNIDAVKLPSARYAGLKGEQLSVNKIEFHYQGYETDEHIPDYHSLKPLAYLSTEKGVTQGPLTYNILSIRAINLAITPNYEKIDPGQVNDVGSLEVEGKVVVKGNLTLNGNISVINEIQDGQTQILARNLLIQDDVITLNEGDTNPPGEVISGININTLNTQDDNFDPIDPDNTGVPALLYSGLDNNDDGEADENTWVVQDGTARKKLTFDFPSENLNMGKADTAHYHSMLKINSTGDDPTEKIAELVDGNLLIKTDQNANNVKLVVNGRARFLNGTLSFSNGLFKPVSFMTYDYIYRAKGDNLNSQADSEVLKSIIFSGKNILVSGFSSKICTIAEPILINNVKNLKISASESLLFKGVSGVPLTSLFKISGTCSNITFENIKVDTGISFCEVEDGADLKNLSIRNCENVVYTTSSTTEYSQGALLSAVHATLKNIRIERCNWYYLSTHVIIMTNSVIRGLSVVNNEFRLDRNSGDPLPTTAVISLALRSLQEDEAAYTEADAIIIEENYFGVQGRLLDVAGGGRDIQLRILDNQVSVLNCEEDTIKIGDVQYLDITGNLFESAVDEGGYAFIVIGGGLFSIKINDNVFTLIGNSAAALKFTQAYESYSFVNNLVRGTEIIGYSDISGARIYNSGNLKYTD